MNRITLANINARNAAPVVGSYICDPDSCSRVHVSYKRPVAGSGQCWHETLRRRLEWQGGPSANAAADLAAWDGLGKKRGAA